MTIGWLGNSSVAMIPTMLDLILHHQLNNYRIEEGDIVVFASVGAGMNVNAIVCRFNGRSAIEDKKDRLKKGKGENTNGHASDPIQFMHNPNRQREKNNESEKIERIKNPK